MTRKILTKEERCQERVSGDGPWDAFQQHQCEKKAVVVRDGIRYCKIHDPEFIKEKDKKRTEEWNEKWERRRLEMKAPMLLDACKRALEASHDPNVEKILMKAISKVEGKDDAI